MYARYSIHNHAVLALISPYVGAVRAKHDPKSVASVAVLPSFVQPVYRGNTRYEFHVQINYLSVAKTRAQLPPQQLRTIANS